MFERNLGNIERIMRLLTGILIAAWAFTRPELSTTELFVVIIGLMLILNGIFSRCYLWYVLNINTARNKDVDCVS